MDNPGEILRLCRLCLVKDQVNIPIFEEQGDIRQIFLKISSCLPVKVSRDDQLPKKICDGCLNKLDLLYEFWNTSVNAEKTLLSWLGQAGVKDADEKISAVAQQIAKSAETQVKQEALEDGHAPEVQSFEEEAKDESEAPPPKRARRTAAVKAQINITPESDDDDDMDSAEAMTKVEDESDESDGEDKDPSYGEVPGTSADDQAGPSGVGKDGVEAPCFVKNEPFDNESLPNMDNIINLQKKHISTIVDNISLKNEQMPNVVNIIDSPYYTLPALSCDICHKTFATWNELENHISTHEEEDIPFSENLQDNCSAVDKELPKPKTHVCELCQKEFANARCLNKHKKWVHTEKRAFLCSKCPNSYKSSVALLAHIKNHSNTPIKCEVCPKMLANKTTLEMHMKRHNQEYFATCELCETKFISVYEQKAHMSTKHAEKKLLCSHCGQEFSCNYSLKSHMKRHDPNFKKGSFKCSDCDRVFDVERYLRRHIRKWHSILKKEYCCDICGKVFTSLDGFKSHKLFHQGEKPLECNLCGKRFLRRNTLKWHIRTHTGEKPHKCDFCEQAFAQPSALKRHMKGVHSLKCPFICLVCGDSFSTKLLLNDHNKAKHPELSDGE